MLIEQDAWYTYNGVQFQVVEVKETLIRIKILGTTKDRWLSKPLVIKLPALRLLESPFDEANRVTDSMKLGDSLYFKTFNGEPKEATIEQFEVFKDNSYTLKVRDRYGVRTVIHPIDVVIDGVSLDMIQASKIGVETPIPTTTLPS